jgi:hypothetical protein
VNTCKQKPNPIYATVFMVSDVSLLNNVCTKLQISWTIILNVIILISFFSGIHSRVSSGSLAGHGLLITALDVSNNIDAF